MILWVQMPDSRALLRGVVRSVWGALASSMGSSSSGSKIIWSSQFDNRTRSKERSCRGSDTGTPVFSRSYLKVWYRHHWFTLMKHVPRELAADLRRHYLRPQPVPHACSLLVSQYHRQWHREDFSERPSSSSTPSRLNMFSHKV